MGLRDTISRLPILLAMLLLPTISVSQIGDVSQAQKHTVSGQVVNSMTGQPVAGALVQIGGEHAMLSDSQGQFEFHDVAAYFGEAQATKPGYFPQQEAISDPNGPAEKKQAVTLKLVPEAIIFGKVMDQNGQALQGLSLLLKTLQVHDGLRHWQQTQSTTTNVEGEFRFAELQAGKYSLATVFLIDGSPESASAVAFAPLVYPPVSATEDSALSLKAGDHVEANLDPPSQRLYAVTGHIEGVPAQGVNFEAERNGGTITNPGVRFNRFTGDFRLLLPSGSYLLKVHGFSQREKFFAAREISIGEAPLKNISITLAPLATVPVEVEYQAGDASGQPTPPPQPWSENLGLEEADPSGLDRTFPAQPWQRSSSPGNSLAIRDLEPGEYRLVARPQPPWYLASATCGALDLRREPITLVGSAAGCSIHAVMRNDSAALNWSVHTDGPGTRGKQIFVYALPLDQSVQPTFSAGAQAQGPDSVIGGSFEGLAPGRYLVMALDHAEELPYREPDAFQRYLSLGKEAMLTANGKSEVQLDLISGEP